MRVADSWFMPSHTNNHRPHAAPPQKSFRRQSYVRRLTAL